MPMIKSVGVAGCCEDGHVVIDFRGEDGSVIHETHLNITNARALADQLARAIQQAEMLRHCISPAGHA